MTNVLSVLRFEIRTQLARRSFWVFTLLLPGIVVVFALGGQLLFGGESSLADPSFVDPATMTQQARTIGYVDHAGLIQSLPAQAPAEHVRAFDSEAAARTALRTGEIGGYYVIAQDYIASGELTLVQDEFNPAGVSSERFESILSYALLGRDELAARFQDPLPVVVHQPLAVPEESVVVDGVADARGDVRESPNSFAPVTNLVPIAFMIMLFLVLVVSSGFMMRSVSREKENRTVEILLVSLRPRQLMLGKLLGLSVVAAVQIGIWLVVALLFSGRTSMLFTMASSVRLPLNLVLWTLVYFVLGYFLYASLMGALGALAPGAREANQFSFVVLSPLMVPLWLNAPIAAAPNGMLATVLSLFPLTAPPVMLSRLAAGPIPVWQPILSVIGLALTSYGAVLLAARFFRADTLLSGSALSFKRVWAELRGLSS